MNKEATYKIENNRMILKVKKAPIILIIILLLFLIFAISIFTITVYQAFYSKKMEFFMLFIPIVSAFSTIFIFRLILWNVYGKELITFSNKSLIYEADYKWFKDGKQEIKDQLGLTIDILLTKQSKGKFATIEFSSMDEKIHCVTKLPIESCNEIKEQLHEKGYLSIKQH